MDRHHERSVPELPKPSNLSWAQLLIVFALVYVIMSQLSAYVGRLTAGRTLDDAFQLILSSALVSSVVNATGHSG